MGKMRAGRRDGKRADVVRGETTDPAATTHKAGRVWAYGPAASDYAARLRVDGVDGVNVIVCDGTDAELALAKAASLRQAGIPFFVTPVLMPVRAANARIAAKEIVAAGLDADRLRLHFEALGAGTLTLNEQAVFDVPAYPPHVCNTMRELVQLADGLLIRSQRERYELQGLLQCSKPLTACVPLRNTAVPNVSPEAGAEDVVIWAPAATPADLQLYRYALAQLQRPAVAVCAQAHDDGVMRCVGLDQAASVLRRAAVVVDTDMTDPGTAIAFAERGFAVAAPLCNGAAEYVQNLVIYDPASFISLWGAVARARTNRRTVVRLHASDEAQLGELLSSQKPRIESPAPLVSIIVPTYNRRELLERNLRAFAAQTYPRIEVVVVNDGGVAVDDIVARFPFAKLVAPPQNVGVVKAVNFGFAHAAGEYIGMLADDDLQYPSHVAALVEGLQSSKLEVAHTDILLRLVEPQTQAGYATYGYTLIFHHDHDPVGVRWGGNATHAMGYLASRRAWEKIGYLDERRDCASDMDTILRFSTHFDIAHVPVVTGEMRYASDNTNASMRAGVKLVDEIRAVLLQHAPPESALTAARIEHVLSLTAACQEQQSFFAPWIRLSRPIDEGNSALAPQ